MTNLHCRFSDVREGAVWWLQAGYYPVPVPYRRKKSKLEGWPALRLTKEQITGYFAAEKGNVGVLLGEPYGNADVDIDCAEALAATTEFLPATVWILCGIRSYHRKCI
jgi:hypothetical protein